MLSAFLGNGKHGAGKCPLTSEPVLVIRSGAGRDNQGPWVQNSGSCRVSGLSGAGQSRSLAERTGASSAQELSAGVAVGEAGAGALPRGRAGRLRGHQGSGSGNKCCVPEAHQKAGVRAPCEQASSG